LKKIAKIAAFAFVFILSTILAISVVNAQTDNQATVILFSSVGGTTNPEPGTYNYAEGTTITLTAIPNEGFEFLYWVASGDFTPGPGSPNIVIIDGEPISVPVLPQFDYITFTTNPAQIICGYGYTYNYQAVFAPITSGLSPPESQFQFFDPDDAFPENPNPSEIFESITFITVSSTVGGDTNPDSGNYLISNQVEPDVTLTATPNEGYEFQHWIVTGDYMPGHGGDPSLDSTVMMENPLNVECGRGYTYNYQAVFTAIESDGTNGNGDGDANGGSSSEFTHPFGLSNEMIYALVAVLAIVAVIGVIFGIYSYNRNKKTP
jgi:hypothetical protein